MRYIDYLLTDREELNFKKGSFQVDIGGRSEGEHQSAFIRIFEDTLSQNNLSLENLKIKSENIGVKDKNFFSSPPEFASCLYSLYLPEI